MDKGTELEIRRIRTEISFLVGDRGGPDHSAEIKELQARLRELLKNA